MESKPNTIYIIVDDHNVVIATGSTEIGENPIAIEIEDEANASDYVGRYRYLDGSLVFDEKLAMETEERSKGSIDENLNKISELEDRILKLEAGRK